MTRKLGAFVAACSVFAAGIGAQAPQAGADHLAPNVCTFAGFMDLDPGVDTIGPLIPGEYDADFSIACTGGSGTWVSTVDSRGTYSSDGSFEGSWDVADFSGNCDGHIEGTRVGNIVVGDIDTFHCGDGPFSGEFTPLSAPVITRAFVRGTTYWV